MLLKKLVALSVLSTLSASFVQCTQKKTSSQLNETTEEAELSELDDLEKYLQEASEIVKTAEKTLTESGMNAQAAQFAALAQGSQFINSKLSELSKAVQDKGMNDQDLILQTSRPEKEGDYSLWKTMVSGNAFDLVDALKGKTLYQVISRDYTSVKKQPVTGTTFNELQAFIAINKDSSKKTWAATSLCAQASSSMQTFSNQMSSRFEFYDGADPIATAGDKSRVVVGQGASASELRQIVKMNCPTQIDADKKNATTKIVGSIQTLVAFKYKGNTYRILNASGAVTQLSENRAIATTTAFWIQKAVGNIEERLEAEAPGLKQ